MHLCNITTVITSSSYSHHCYDDKFPGVCFLGEPLQYKVQSDPVTISPSGLGITIKIPANAVPPGKCANIVIRPCLSGPFHYPEGYEPLSAVYHISADTHFLKSIELEFIHFGKLVTKEKASKIAFCSAKSSPADVGGKQMFRFNCIEGGKFAVGDNHGRISFTHFCFLSVAGCEPKSTWICVCSDIQQF